MQRKKFVFLTVLFILVLFSVTACDDSSDDNSNNGGSVQPQPVAEVIINDNTLFALLPDKSLFSWGLNDEGQLGVGSNELVSEKPVYISGITGSIKKIFTDSNSTYALTEDNSLYAWGNNGYGRLGVGDTENKNAPAKVNGIEGIIKHVYTDDHSAYTLTEDGTLYTWGWNHNGQLGIGSVKQHSDVPSKVTSINSPVKDIYTSNFSLYALTEDGSLYVWGNNQQGKLGTGDTADKRTPVKIESLDGKIIQMHYGSIPTVFALTENNTLYGWGDNQNSQLCLDSTVKYSENPVKINGITGIIKEVYTDGSSVFVLTEDNTLYAWGYNYKGRLGLGLDDAEVNTPTKVEGINGKIKKIYTSNFSFTYILTEDNTLYTWGDNKYGIGTENTAAYINKPEIITGITGNIKDIYINGYATYALTDDNSLYVWGNNEYGQLGIGEAKNTYTPVKVNGINGIIKDIYTYDASIYTVTEDGALYTWGDNSFGQLGLGSTETFIKTPVKVNINSSVSKVYTNHKYSIYVVTNDNAVYSFGYNELWVDVNTPSNCLLGRDGLNYEPQKILFNK